MKAVNLPVGLRAKLHPLEAAGYWPFAPLTGPMSDTPAGEDMQDMRQVEGEWTKDPGWWRKLRAMPDNDRLPEKVNGKR